jgi:hypothetical protein
MKNLKQIIKLSLVLAMFTGCQDNDHEFGPIVAPSNLQVEVVIQGQDADSPNGDGTGNVTLQTTSDNALAYKYIYDGDEFPVSNGIIDFTFTGDSGVVGEIDLYTFTVNVVAYGTAGEPNSTSVTFDVLAVNVPPPFVFEDFEGTPAIVWTEFQGHPGQVIDNPYPQTSGINTSNKVVSMIEASGGAVWAGCFFDTEPLNFDSYSKISLLVYAPRPASLTLKLEGTGGSIEVEAQISVIDKWINVTFDFSEAQEDIDYTRLVFFFNVTASGDNSTYYIDDLTLRN